MADIKKNYGAMPFGEALDYFRGKVNLPTKRWDDLQKGQHARAFVVAGAEKTGLLTDLRAAVDKIISEGETLEGFRARFDDIVKKNGWIYKGGRNWRTRVIYDTNLRTAYMAGRYKQMIDPDVTALRPFWQYRHGGSVHPRPHHLALNGLVLRYDDPFWNTHYPPNGWGCRCYVVTLSARDLTRMGKTGPDETPEIKYQTYTDRTGQMQRIPEGIDPGWDYNVGQAAWGKRLSEEQMDAWRASGPEKWQRLTPGDFKTANRPEMMPLDPPKAALDDTIRKTASGMQAAIEKVLGAPEKVFQYEKDGFSWGVLVNAESLSTHIDAARAAYIPLLPETMSDPYEIWMTFERHTVSGKIELRQRIIKAVSTGRDQGMLVVTNVINGIMEAWTLIPVENLNYLNRQRAGKLVWARDMIGTSPNPD